MISDMNMHVDYIELYTKLPVYNVGLSDQLCDKLSNLDFA